MCAWVRRMRVTCRERREISQGRFALDRGIHDDRHPEPDAVRRKVVVRGPTGTASTRTVSLQAVIAVMAEHRSPTMSTS